MRKNHVLMASAACCIIAAGCGCAALGAAAFSVGLASIGLFIVSTQVRE